MTILIICDAVQNVDTRGTYSNCDFFLLIYSRRSHDSVKLSSTVKMYSIYTLLRYLCNVTYFFYHFLRLCSVTNCFDQSVITSSHSLFTFNF